MLGNGQFEINGYRFGCDGPVKVHTMQTGGLRWRVQVLGDHRNLRQDRTMPDLLSLQNAPQQALMCGDRAR